MKVSEQWRSTETSDQFTARFVCTGRGSSNMPGIASPKQLKILSKTVDDYCAASCIPEGEDRENVARFVMYLFEAGHRTAEELMLGLEGSDAMRAMRLRYS